jgi:hypothetical protein
MAPFPAEGDLVFTNAADEAQLRATVELVCGTGICALARISNEGAAGSSAGSSAQQQPFQCIVRLQDPARHAFCAQRMHGSPQAYGYPTLAVSLLQLQPSVEFKRGPCEAA